MTVVSLIPMISSSSKKESSPAENRKLQVALSEAIVKTKEEQGVGFEYDEQENEDGNGIYPYETQDNRDKYSCPKIP